MSDVIEIIDVSVTVDQIVEQVTVDQATETVVVESSFVAPPAQQVVPAYGTLVDQDTSTTCYVGDSPPGSAPADPVWRIRKISEQPAGLTSVTWAENDTSFAYSWDDRTQYIYGEGE
jgi:hypothetical protein